MTKREALNLVPVSSCRHPEESRRYYLLPVDYDADAIGFHCPNCRGDFSDQFLGPMLTADPLGIELEAQCYTRRGLNDEVGRRLRANLARPGMTVLRRGAA